MAMLRLCKFYKDTESLNTGAGISYCDLDCHQTTCAGDINSCSKSDLLKRYFFEQIRKGGGFEWERRMNTLFLGDPKARA
jgi:hypothetical protein